VGRVVVELRTTAPPERVWRALTEPDAVAAWDELAPLEVPAGYPAPGQHARWRTRVGPLRLTLHDRVGAVAPERRLASVIDVGFVRVEEEYRLEALDGPGSQPAGTRLVSDNLVHSRLPGLGRLADRLVRHSVVMSMDRLRQFCEDTVASG
jgi:hypothetical protein